MSETQKPKMKRKSRQSLQARTFLVDKLNAHKFYQSNLDEVSKAVQSVREHFNLLQCEWTYLDGYGDAIIQGWQYKELIYCAYWEGKPIPMQWNDIPEEFREFIRQGGQYVSGHFWKNKDGTVGKPYFTSWTGKPTFDPCAPMP
jgi:hypothetical protein